MIIQGVFKCNVQTKEDDFIDYYLKFMNLKVGKRFVSEVQGVEI